MLGFFITLGRCRGWLTDRGSNGRRRREEFYVALYVMFDAELKRRRQAAYPGLTLGMAMAVQYDPQRKQQVPTGHIVQLLYSTSRNSFSPRRTLFEKPGSNDGFNIWSMCLSMTGLA